MFGLGVMELVVGVLLILLAEVAVFWAATALGDLPPMGWGKFLLVAVGASAITGALLAFIVGLAGNPATLLDPEKRLSAVLFGGLGLLVLWAVPAALYVPMLAVSVGRSMQVSVFQWLLRIFLYVLIAAVVMVVLAVVQIWRGSNVHSQLTDPPRAALFR